MRTLGTLFGVIIGLGFIFGGLLIVLGTVIPTYQTWDGMQHWQSTPADLTSISFSSDGIKASYRFSVTSIDYYNNRIDINESTDRTGDFYQQMFQRLKDLKDNDQSVDVWYDPLNPGQSLLNREISWGRLVLLSCMSFILAICGFFIIYKVITAKRIKKMASSSSLDKLKKQWRQNQQEDGYQESFVDFCEQQKHLSSHPRTNRLRNPFYYNSSHPWLNKKEWRNNRMGSGSKRSLYALWVFSVIWTILSSSLLFVIEDELYKGNYAVLIGALFPIIGLYLINKAWQQTKVWKRYGNIELELNPFPGIIGDHVGGKLFINNVEDINRQYQVGLECVHNSFSRRGKSKRRREKVRWSEVTIPDKAVVDSGIQLKFNFSLPEALPEAGVRQVGKYYSWRLRVYNDLDLDSENGSYNNLISEYNIPVFNRREQPDL